MSQLQFWQKNTLYALGAYVLDGAGNIQQLTAPLGGGTSGSSTPAWTQTTTPDNGLTWTFVGLGGKANLVEKPSPEGMYVESLDDAVSYSRGAADAGKFVLLDAAGQLDTSMGGGGGTPTFDKIQTGDNTTATMTVGSGGSLSYTGTGIVNASQLGGTPVSGPATSAGQIPIYDGTNYVPGDPLVQGLYAAGTAVSGINPVLIGAEDPSGNLADLKVDASGNLNSDVTAWSGQTVGAATNTAPTGAEYAPVFRSLDFKSTSTVVNGPVGAGSSTYSSWLDSQATGAMYAETTAICSVPTPALVQHASAPSISTGGTLAFPQNITKGNLLVVFFTQGGYPIADTLGNTWAFRANSVSYGPYIVTAIANASGACSIDYPAGSGATIIMEFSGVDTFDTVAAAGNTSGTALASGNTAATTYPVELVMDFFLATSAFTESAGDGTTPIASQAYGAGSPTIYTSYKVTSSTGVQNASGTQTASGIWWAVCLVFYSSANAITSTNIGLQETDDTSNALATSTFASAPVTAAGSPFTSQGTIAKRYYRSFLTTGPAVTVEQTITSSSETPELLDLSGNQKFIFGTQFQTGVLWSSTTNLNAVQTIISNSGVPCVVVQLNQSSGTFSAGAVTFEGTRDGTNWETVPGDILFDPKTLTAAPNPYTLVSSTNKAFLIQTTGYVAIRLALSTAITGTGTVTPYVNTASYDPLPLNSGIYNATPPTLTGGQAGALQLSQHGAQYTASYVAGAPAQAFKTIKAVSVTAGTPAVVWTPATGKSFRIQGYNLSLSVAGSIIFEDGSGTEFARTPTLLAATPDKDQFGNGYLSTAVNNGLFVDVTASGSVSGYVWGVEE